MAAQEGALALAGEEAEVLALGLSRHRQPVAGGELAHLGLRSSASGKRSRPSSAGGERREHVGLVLGGVGGGREQRALAVVDDPRVVAGRQSRGAEPVGERDHRLDPHLAVADHARVRGPPGAVAGDELADHRPAELLLEVERQVRDARASGRARGRRAPPPASSSSARRRWRWSAHSFSVTATTSAPRSRSSSAATAESTPPLIATSTRSPARRRLGERTSPTPRRRRARDAARRRRARPRGVPGARARRAPRRPRPAPIGAASSTGSPSASSVTAAPAARAAAQPSASNDAVGDATAVDRQRDPDQVAARRAAGGAA